MEMTLVIHDYVKNRVQVKHVNYANVDVLNKDWITGRIIKDIRGKSVPYILKGRAPKLAEIASTEGIRTSVESE